MNAVTSPHYLIVRAEGRFSSFMLLVSASRRRKHLVSFLRAPGAGGVY
jgi:hypothetical protein